MSAALQLRLANYEGPLDLLLDLARAQKVDLASIDVVGLVDQYLAVLEGARRVRVEFAADWLVMAAWLTWLKSRLLLPDPEPDPDAEEAAGNLTDRLRDLEALRAQAAWLAACPVLGRDVWDRGAPERLSVERDGALRADMSGLLAAWMAASRRAAARRPYVLNVRRIWTVREAADRLARLLNGPGWSDLLRFLPAEDLTDPVERRAALASTLIAGLEMARGGALDLQQEKPFGPILLHRLDTSAGPGREDAVAA